MILGAPNQTFPNIWKDLTFTVLWKDGSIKGINPSDIHHGNTTTAGTNTYVLVPDSFKDLWNTHVLIPALEKLSFLELEDELQIPFLPTIVKETVVADLLKSVGDHMHQKPADKLCVFNGDLSSGISGFFAPGGESGVGIGHLYDPAVGYRDLISITAEVFDVNYYDRYEKTEDENPTVGILLCQDNNDSLVELTLPEDANIYAAKYKLYLPDKKLLQEKLRQWLEEEGDI